MEREFNAAEISAMRGIAREWKRLGWTLIVASALIVWMPSDLRGALMVVAIPGAAVGLVVSALMRPRRGSQIVPLPHLSASTQAILVRCRRTARHAPRYLYATLTTIVIAPLAGTTVMDAIALSAAITYAVIGSRLDARLAGVLRGR